MGCVHCLYKCVDIKGRKRYNETMTTTPKKPSLRTLVQHGTEWKLTEDVPIYAVKKGVRYAEGIADWDIVTTIKAGETIQITSKKMTTWGTQAGHGTLSFKGLWLQAKRLTDGQEWTIQFSDFNKNPVLLSEQKVIPFYVLRDKDTGLFYEDHTYDWTKRAYNPDLVMTDKPSKARKFKRLADSRSHMLIKSGYYEGLPDTDAMPEWMRNNLDSTVVWPENFEIVEIDKVTKSEINTWETKAYLEQMWRLRALTLAFGSSVRAMYKKLEEKNQLGEYPVMVVWRHDGTNYWDYEMADTELAAIKETHKLMPKGQSILIKNGANACLACINEGTAWAATQFYTGKLIPHVISLSTLLECVPTNTSTLQTKVQEAPEVLDLPDLDL